MYDTLVAFVKIRIKNGLYGKKNQLRFLILQKKLGYILDFIFQEVTYKY